MSGIFWHNADYSLSVFSIYFTQHILHRWRRSLSPIPNLCQAPSRPFYCYQEHSVPSEILQWGQLLPALSAFCISTLLASRISFCRVSRLSAIWWTISARSSLLNACSCRPLSRPENHLILRRWIPLYSQLPTNYFHFPMAIHSFMTF